MISLFIVWYISIQNFGENRAPRRLVQKGFGQSAVASRHALATSASAPAPRPKPPLHPSRAFPRRLHPEAPNFLPAPRVARCPRSTRAPSGPLVRLRSRVLAETPPYHSGNFVIIRSSRASARPMKGATASLRARTKTADHHYRPLAKLDLPRVPRAMQPLPPFPRSLGRETSPPRRSIGRSGRRRPPPPTEPAGATLLPPSATKGS
jgi:hypothetical protein